VNWAERSVIAVVLLVAGGAILVALNALGVGIPWLSDAVPQGRSFIDEERDLEPPDLPAVDDEAGLLAELRAGGPNGFGPDADGRIRGLPDEPAGEDEPVSAGAAAAAAESEEEAGSSRDPLVDQLKAKVDVKDPGQLLAFLMATFTPKGTKLSGEDLEFLFEALAVQEDWGVRNLLLAHLERIGGEEVTEGVLGFLKEAKDPASLNRALSALRSLNDEAAVTGIVQFLSETKNRRLREAAFKNLLATKNGAVATEPLLRVLDEARDPNLKRYALAALSQLGGEAGAQAILRFAVSSDPQERSLGLKSLRDVKSRAAVPALSASLGRYTDPRVQVQVLRSLGKIRDPRSVPAVTHVVAYGTNRGTRFEALRTLAQIGRAEAVPTLRQLAESDPDKSIRRGASRTISVIERAESRRAALNRR